MTPQDVKKKILESYMDEFGFVTIDKNADVHSKGMGNGLMHTGFFYAYLGYHGLLTEEDAYRWRKTIESTTARHPLTKEPVSGLYYRHPYKMNDDQSHDDYYAVMAASFYFAMAGFAFADFSRDVIRYGEAHGWIYNARQDGNNAAYKSFDRFPGLIIFYKMANRQVLGFWEQLPAMFRLLVMTHAKKGDSDSRVHAFLMLSVTRFGSGLMNVLFVYWKLFTSKLYGSVGGGMRGYFDETFGMHPFVSGDY